MGRDRGQVRHGPRSSWPDSQVNLTRLRVRQVRRSRTGGTRVTYGGYVNGLRVVRGRRTGGTWTTYGWYARPSTSRPVCPPSAPACPLRRAGGPSGRGPPGCTCPGPASPGVVPENPIRAEMGVSSGELAYARAANSGEYLRNEGFLARESPDLRGPRVLRSRAADANEPLGEFKPRGDSGDANRRLAGSRSPFLPMDARLDVAPVHYIPAKDEHAIRDSTRSSS